MTAGRYAILEDGCVVNVIMWNDTDPFSVLEGQTIQPCSNEVMPGWEYDDGEWVAPEPEPEPELPAEDPAVVAAKESALAQLVALGISDANARVIVGLPAA